MNREGLLIWSENVGLGIHAEKTKCACVLVLSEKKSLRMCQVTTCMNHTNKYKLHARRNPKQIKMKQCLVSFSPEPSAFPSAVHE